VCSYCDTAYAFTEGSKTTFADILKKVGQLSTAYKEANRASIYSLPLIELTGGEPLLQPNSLWLMKILCDAGYTVLVETSGALDISGVDPRVRRIMDLKCPSSGEVERNRFENIQHLKGTDEIKFVIGTVEDYEWAKQQLSKFSLPEICPILFSWVSPLQEHQRVAALKSVPPGQTAITRKELVERIVADALPVRFQLQMHKFIWPPDERGV
jgi:7-carboxy-7-deazaguanine synthase